MIVLPLMSKSLFPQLLSRPGLLKGLHRALELAVGRLGFRFEEHRTGEARIGLWRLPYRKKPRGRSPRRLVFIPGFGDTPLSWMLTLGAMRPALSRNYDELVCLDFPAFAGFLREHRAIPSLDLLLERVADTLDALRPQALMGHSLGGWLAADYALRLSEGSRPAQAGAERGPGLELLTLIAPSGVFGTDQERREWESVFHRSMREGFAALRTHMFEKEPFWFPLIAREIGAFTQREDVREFMDSFGTRHRLEPRLGKLSTPQVWIVWGDRDRLVPAGWLPHWHRALEGAPATVRSVSIRGIGHNPQLEAPAVTAAILSQIVLGREPHWAGSRFWTVHEG